MKLNKTSSKLRKTILANSAVPHSYSATRASVMLLELEHWIVDTGYWIVVLQIKEIGHFLINCKGHLYFAENGREHFHNCSPISSCHLARDSHHRE